MKKLLVGVVFLLSFSAVSAVAYTMSLSMNPTVVSVQLTRLDVFTLEGDELVRSACALVKSVGKDVPFFLKIYVKSEGEDPVLTVAVEECVEGVPTINEEFQGGYKF